MKLYIKILILAIVLIIVLLKKLNLLVNVRIEKQTQGPFTLMYKEYVGYSYGKALRLAMNDFKRIKVGAFPIAIINFDDSKKSPSQ
eukprot:gnl/Chilomastix_caulleri/1401.p3 GENE.gnl/Chilomastix_caulleri/1401~~gnl/Chilomastix_caulleri/1401.p3  ORF type:complete len:86 (+),score=11.71 gnl/Chilomastix_caulleri/1401:80-337(+)